MWRVPSIGSVGLQLTETKHPQRDVHPSLSPDGSALLFYSNRSGSWGIWQVDLNTSSASIPIAIDEAVRSGKMKEGHKLLMIGFGGGLSWGGVLFEW